MLQAKYNLLLPSLQADTSIKLNSPLYYLPVPLLFSYFLNSFVSPIALFFVFTILHFSTYKYIWVSFMPGCNLLLYRIDCLFFRIVRLLGDVVSGIWVVFLSVSNTKVSMLVC